MMLTDSDATTPAVGVNRGANDAVLHPLLAAGSENARDEALGHILLTLAVPVIDAVRKKSGRFGRRARFEGADEEDIRAGAMYRITRRIMADLNAHPIAAFADYCAAVALHALQRDDGATSTTGRAREANRRHYLYVLERHLSPSRVPFHRYQHASN